MKKKIIYIIYLVLVVTLILFPNIVFAENIVYDEMQINTQEKIDIFKNITAPNLLLAETNTGRILYERNADERIYPASLTKLMTAILVVENCELDEIVTGNSIRKIKNYCYDKKWEKIAKKVNY